MSMPTVLGERLKRIRDKAKKIRDISNAVGDGNEASSQQKADVEEALEAMGDDLTDLHDPNAEPSLDPPSAGTPQNPAIPSSRLQTCEDALQSAEEAYTVQTTGSTPNYDYIGDRTRTLEASFVPAVREDFGLV
ncbi:MAG: hypothetical protein GY716_13655 [bacterium]|nr:hypothetical protein [bacterium]